MSSRQTLLFCAALFLHATLVLGPVGQAHGFDCRVEPSVNPCSPGGGRGSSDCIAEWVLHPQPLRNRKGILKNRVACVEGDASCDVDAEPNVCTFAVALCINNHDPRLPLCNSPGVESLEILAPRVASQEPTDIANRASLEALTLCDAPGLCLHLLRNGYSVERPGGTTQRNDTHDACSELVYLRVPQAIGSDGVALRSKRSFKFSTNIGENDRDTLHFECLPATCGNGLVENTREQCDDGNRMANDGCDVSCQIEVPTPSPSPVPTETFTPSLSPTLVATPSTTPSASPSRSATVTPTLVATPSATASASPSYSVAATPTALPTETFTASPSSTLSVTPSATASASPSYSATETPTASPTESFTPSPSATLVPTPSASASASPSPSASATPTPTPTSTASTTATPDPCDPDGETYSEPTFYRSLAYRWAPLIMQDTASKWNADFLGRMDFDGDWRSNNNWNNLPSQGIAPYLYYDVLETATHWFIHYHTFHPRDWNDVFFGACGPDPDCHENDTENILIMVQKDGSTYGRFRVLQTMAHGNFYQYALAGDGVANGSGPDGDDLDNDSERGFALFTDAAVGVTEPRPAVYIESKGHGICDWWDNNGPSCSHPDDKVGTGGNDGLMYYPDENVTPSVPPNPKDGNWYNFKSPYNLISIWDDVWVLRSCLSGAVKTFDDPFIYPGVAGNGSAFIGKSMDGDDHADDAGTAWWAQGDDDNNLASGAWTIDPAATVLRQLTFSELVDTTYSYNPYLGID